MFRPIWAVTLGAAVFSWAVAPAMANPAKELATCVACHDITAAKKPRVGPPLFGLYGQKPTMTGVKYKKWDQASLDEWLKNPSAVKPGTTMAFMVPNAAQRAKIIKALSELK